MTIAALTASPAPAPDKAKAKAKGTGRGTRLAAVIVLAAAAVLAVFLFVKRIPQDLNYHQFADQRTLLGIPNALNVFSNLPFLLVGTWGIVLVMRRPRGDARMFLAEEEKYPYLVFFFAVLLVTFGSGYYHWRPNNATLMWDRLPMALGFMALLAALAGERIGVRWGSRLLPALTVVGAASVLYWHWTELAGRGDLRPYGIVQFLPAVLIPMLIALFPPRYSGTGWLLGAAGFYGLAKLFEAWDGAIFRVVHSVSGHTLKHCAAAAATACVAIMLAKRQPVGEQ